MSALGNTSGRGRGATHGRDAEATDGDRSANDEVSESATENGGGGGVEEDEADDEESRGGSLTLSCSNKAMAA